MGAPRGPLGGSWGYRWRKGSKCQVVFPLLGPSWAVFGALWAVLGPSRAALGPSSGLQGPSWDDHGGPLGRLGRCEDEKGEFAKNVRFPKGMTRFVPLGALSAVLWEHTSAVIGPFGAVLKPSWTVVGLPWAVSTLCWTVLALCLGLRGPSWGFVEAPDASGMR